MVHKGVKVELTVKQLRQDNPEYNSVVFERPANFEYEAGDWIDLDFADTSFSGGKTYSLSSSPTESELVISFREGASPFKRKLQSVQAGDKMYISQYGNDYGFRLKGNRSSILIAGGIGIAPFRSMLKEMFDVSGKNNVQLIYFNKSHNFLFRDELDEWQRSLADTTILYVETNQLKRKARENLLRSVINSTNHSYYIAGPAGLINSTFSFLKSIGVNSKNIRIDNFGTY